MSRSSIGSRTRIEMAKARLRDGWASVLGLGPEDGAPPTRKAAEAVAGQLKTLGQEVTRRDLLLTGLAAGVGGLAMAVRQGPGRPAVPVADAPPPSPLEMPRDFAALEDLPALDPLPSEPLPGSSLSREWIEPSEPLAALPPHPVRKPRHGTPLGPLLAERRLAMVNENTGESVNAVYWANGDYVLEGLEDIQILLRDHHTDEMHAIDLKLVETLYRLSQVLDSQRPLHVLSAYRSPRTNARLALRYDGVAENSFHMKGKAVDLYIPGRRKRDLARAALNLRVGGVGVYSSFVHVDTGPIRRWHS